MDRTQSGGTGTTLPEYLLHNDHESVWVNMDFQCEERVLSKSWEFVDVALNSFMTMDFALLAKNTRAFNWASPYIVEGGAADFFDWGAMTQTMVIAECCCNLRLFDQAYSLVESCLDLLDYEGNPRPNKHLRLATLRIIAECKWQQSKSRRDRLWAPEWICEEYEKKYRQVMEMLNERPEVDKDGSFSDSLETTGFSVIKMAARFLPERLPEMIGVFNSRWGASLASLDGHFLANKQRGSKARCYWDFEIAKRWISGELTLDELEYCNDRLLAATENELRGDVRNYLISLDLQYRYMAKKFTNILEFPAGLSPTDSTRS